MQLTIGRLALPLTLIPSLSLHAQSPAVAERIRRVENGLQGSIAVRGQPGAPIAERMRFFHVPGVSIAVINNGAIEWARGYGVAAADGGVPVDTGTLFQAASISKPVAATAALRLVQEGRLSLDEDVNARLTSWKVPENAFTAAHKVTLRGILSHGAGLTVHGFRGYAAGEPVPTLRQVLDGAPPANSAAIRVEGEPGSRWSYSGGGYTILQQLLEDVTGTPFPALMRRTVLDPLGMASSGYDQPLPAARAPRAATAHDRDGKPIPGRWHTYPEMAAAGLWTTPSDLARFAIAIQRMRAGSPDAPRVLAPATVRQMLTVQIGQYGLGLALADSGRIARFSHGGANEGFRCALLAFAETGQGVVVMTNGDNGGALIDEIVHAVAAAYEWPTLRAEWRSVAAISDSAMRALEGRYRFGPGEQVATVSREGGRLYLSVPFEPTDELLPQSDSTFLARGDGATVRFTRDASGRVAEVVLEPRGGARPIRARREDH